MSIRFMTWVLSPLVLLVLSIPPALGDGKPNATREQDTSVPFFCFTQAWDPEFTVVSTRLDVEKRQVVWMLEAKKDTKVAIYEAEVNDEDNVNMVTVRLKTNPGTGDVKAGAKIRVVASVSYVLYLDQICRINIRSRKESTAEDGN